MRYAPGVADDDDDAAQPSITEFLPLRDLPARLAGGLPSHCLSGVICAAIALATASARGLCYAPSGLV